MKQMHFIPASGCGRWRGAWPNAG